MYKDLHELHKQKEQYEQLFQLAYMNKIMAVKRIIINF